MEKKLKELIKNYGKPIDTYRCLDFIEATFKEGGDILTFRIYKNGMITER